MASELLPCPFCGATAKAKPMGSASFTVMCENLHRMNSFPSKAEAIEAWNTRPAPAATDTGLVTVGEVSTVRKSIAAFAGHMLSRQLKPGDLLCLRSQAEEILAAKDARVKELEETKAVIAADKKTLLDLAATNGDKVTALEVKLAAAEQFIQFCADGFFVTDDELRGAARAVLGGKPS